MSTATRKLVPLSSEDKVAPRDQWSPKGTGTWCPAWEEDVGLTIAQIEEKAKAQGEPGAYEWRGVR